MRVAMAALAAMAALTNPAAQTDDHLLDSFSDSLCDSNGDSRVRWGQTVDTQQTAQSISSLCNTGTSTALITKQAINELSATDNYIHDATPVTLGAIQDSTPNTPANVGDVLTVGALSHPSLTVNTHAWQWQRCTTQDCSGATAISSNGTAATYTVQAADQGNWLRVQVIQGGDFNDNIFSNSVRVDHRGVIGAITNDTRAGSTLTASTATDAGTITYQWHSDDANNFTSTASSRINDATDSSDTIPAVQRLGDEGNIISATSGPTSDTKVCPPAQGPGIRYRVTFQANWTETTHPTNFPPGPHFSSLIGAVHSSGRVFWQTGNLASPGIEAMAETGATGTLKSEIDAMTEAISYVGNGIGNTGQTTIDFYVSEDCPFVTFVSMLAPSHDWFVGINKLNLRNNMGEFVNRTVDLRVYDAGTEEGDDFSFSGAATNPATPITRLTTAANDTDFNNGVNRQTGAFVARFIFTTAYTASPGNVTISGTATVGQTLTANVTDANGVNSLVYQWQRGDITGAPGSFRPITDQMNASYTLVDADLGGTIRLETRYEEDGGTSRTVFSNPTDPVSNRATLDVDGSGGVANQSDGLLIGRYLFGIRNTAGLLDTIPGNPSFNEVTANIVKAVASGRLDVDGSGGVPNQSDGLIIGRYLFGIRDATGLLDTIPGNPSFSAVTTNIRAILQ